MEKGKKMLEKMKEKLKNKSFWGGVLAATASLLTGALSAPEFFVNLINLIGG